MRLPTKELVFAALCGLVAACGGSSDVPTLSGTPVASITVTPTTVTLSAGAIQQVTALAQDANGKRIDGKRLSWSTSNAAVATVTSEFNAARITAVAAGTATLTGESDGTSATISVTVNGVPECVAENSVSMNVGEVRTLSNPDKTQLCVGSANGGAEYKLVVVNTSTATTVSLSAINTQPVNTSALVHGSAFESPLTTKFDVHADASSFAIKSDAEFIERQNDALRREFPNGFPKAKSRPAMRLADLPREGDVVSLKLNFGIGGTCSTIPPEATARVVKVGQNVILYADLSWTDLVYTDEQFASLAATLDTVVYPLDTLNYGVPNDIDGNGRVKVLFSPAVLAAGLYGVVVPGDFLPAISCARSNEAEMTYLATPVSNGAGRAGNRESMLAFTPYLFAHELQHVINQSIRGDSPESAALNEGLSYLAVELLFYKVAGLTPGMNLGSKFANPAANDAFLWSSELFSYYFVFALNSASNSPYNQVPSTATFGALWNLLRFGADRRGGDQSALWRSMVNTRTSGITNLGKLGNTNELLRDWAVSQVVDDVVPGIAPNYQFPSWNYRTFVVTPSWPLVERNLSNTPITVSLVNGGSSYFQFRVNAGTFASIRTNTDGAVPVADLMLVRSK